MNRRSQLLVLAAVAASTPATLGLESLLRLLLPPELEEMRLWLNPKVAPVGWALVALAAASVLVAVFAQRPLLAWLLARERPASTPEAARTAQARLATLLLATSITQVPALLATVAFLFGADALSTYLTIGIGTVGVLAQWPALQRLR
ncbi:MAG: hypothetical protein QM765_47665 [Myxococcales bacterium]